MFLYRNQVLILKKYQLTTFSVLMTMKSLILENLYLEPIDTGEISLAELF